jgi:membrane-associated protease RseP (regulator of RpoE activity)
VVFIQVILATNARTRPLLSILGLALIITLVHLGGFVIAALLARVPIEEIRFFYGPKLLRWKIGSTTLSIGCIPGGSVSCKKIEEAGGAVDQRSFEGLPTYWRVAIIASGPLALFALGSVCIGSAETARSFVRGFQQVIIGAILPLSEGHSLVAKTVEIFQSKGFVVVLGILASKMTAQNLLPIPPANGGQLLLELLGNRFRNSRARYVTTFFGLFVFILMLIGWLIAVGKFIFESFPGVLASENA